MENERKEKLLLVCREFTDLNPLILSTDMDLQKLLDELDDLSEAILDAHEDGRLDASFLSQQERAFWDVHRRFEKWMADNNLRKPISIKNACKFVESFLGTRPRDRSPRDHEQLTTNLVYKFDQCFSPTHESSYREREAEASATL